MRPTANPGLLAALADWQIGLLAGGLSVGAVFLTYRLCQTVYETEGVLPRWARQQGYRIIRQEIRYYSHGPFPQNRYRPVMYVSVEDPQGRRKKGWVRLGWWYVVGFHEHIEVRWED